MFRTGRATIDSGVSRMLRQRAPSVASPEEIRCACVRYLREMRDAAPDDYPRIEERAWRRLVSNLDALGAPLEPPNDN